MTRINLIAPQELCDQHLLAEWREMTRIPNGIASGRHTISTNKIPPRYTIRTNANPGGGKGHVTFFFDKLKFLRCRYQALLAELHRREMPQVDRWPTYAFPVTLWNDYTPSLADVELNRARLAERTPKRPRYAGVSWKVRSFSDESTPST